MACPEIGVSGACVHRPQGLDPGGSLIGVSPPAIYSPHPRGNAGAIISVRKTVQAAASGRQRPKVVEWARRKIGEAGNPDGNEAKAKALLDAIKSEKFFIPDPVDGEFIAAPECLLADCDGLSFDAGDCDELAAALAAAIEAIGITVAIVAQAFNPEGDIQHVLCAVEVSPGVWKYADPTERELEFGQAKKPEREVWLLVPSGKLLCDHKPGCMSKMQGIHPQTGDRKTGDFVSVGVGRSDQSTGAVGGTEGSSGMSWGSALLGVAVAVAATAGGFYLLTGKSPMKLIGSKPARSQAGPGWYVEFYENVGEPSRNGELKQYEGPFSTERVARQALAEAKSRGDWWTIEDSTTALRIKHRTRAPF